MKKKKHELMAKKKMSMIRGPVSVKVVEKRSGEAPEEHAFVLKDGRKLRTMYQLIDELETMPDPIFKEYVTPFKNDFSNWLKDVFQERDLAEEIKGMRERMDTHRAVLKHVIRELKKHHLACKGC